jgi:hypothetical protein
MSYKAHMHGGRESSGGIVLTKRSNEGQGGPQETVEGRPLAKGQVQQSIPAPDTVPDKWANTWLSGGATRPMPRRGAPRWEPCALCGLQNYVASSLQTPLNQ